VIDEAVRRILDGSITKLVCAAKAANLRET